MAGRHACREAVAAGGIIRAAVDAAFAGGLRSFETGGGDGTSRIAGAVLAAVSTVPPAAG